MADISSYNGDYYAICIVISIIIVLFTLILIIIYSKTKKFHSYPCYLHLILSFVIAIDNIFRLIPMSVIEDRNKKEKEKSGGCKFQAFVLTLFDKLLLTTMTVYSIIIYFGFAKTQFYKKYEPKIFIISNIVSFLLSLILTIVFADSFERYDDICYVNNSDKKKIVDCIVTSLLMICNVIFLVMLLLSIRNLRLNSSGKSTSSLTFYFYKYIINLILNLIIFIIVILIILDKFIDSEENSDEIIDLIYCILGLFIVIFFTTNSSVKNEALNLICCKKVEDKNANSEDSEDDDYDDDKKIELKNSIDKIYN